MKFMIFAFLSILCVQEYVDASESIVPYDPNSNQTSHCYSTVGDIGAMKEGEEKRLAHVCALANCKPSRDIIIEGCGAAVVQPPCRIGEGDLTKPYPDCCFEIICP
ncbi:unnamed protein product [Phaedon cochleariae]|uniref:Single domain-containing protein n=1 Tax=Phaedon cochleariae TaxID=80249 RepID=A0A9P0DL05_PHACE|nr:unnamed protein product [Phaedon cochleariae]